MRQVSIIDTFPFFQEYWKKFQGTPLETQVEGWAAEYMVQWPELLDKQLNDYSDQHVDWKKLSSQKIFPHISSRMPAMESAHQNIIDLFPSLCQQAFRKMDINIDMAGIVYVGIGCGAGWATTYQGKPAILFGLENCAECNWVGPVSISGLIAHEIGHLIQDTWRKQAGRVCSKGAWWQLFTEGFAQRCEHIILERDSWHEASNGKNEWVAWCTDKRAYLAGEFLRYAAEGKEIQPFFGSWYDIEGYSQCGCYLGHEAIRALEEAGMSMYGIAILEDPQRHLQKVLEKIAEENA